MSSSSSSIIPSGSFVNQRATEKRVSRNFLPKIRMFARRIDDYGTDISHTHITVDWYASHSDFLKSFMGSNVSDASKQYQNMLSTSDMVLHDHAPKCTVVRINPHDCDMPSNKAASMVVRLDLPSLFSCSMADGIPCTNDQCFPICKIRK